MGFGVMSRGRVRGQGLRRSVKNCLKFLTDAAEWDRHFRKSWSQEGEDMILARFFGQRPSGFYVDVGAHDPFRFSNTYKFYKRGWRGINIDGLPGSMRKFERYRQKDTNLEIAISSSCKEMPFYVFNEPALSGFDGELSRERVNRSEKYWVEEIVYLRPQRLGDVLAMYMPVGQTIDFLNVDVEGFDFHVLESNNWERFRPTMLLVEMRNVELHDILQMQTYTFLRKKGYTLYGKTVNTVFFLEV